MPQRRIPEKLVKNNAVRHIMKWNKDLLRRIVSGRVLSKPSSPPTV